MDIFIVEMVGKQQTSINTTNCMIMVCQIVNSVFSGVLNLVITNITSNI